MRFQSTLGLRRKLHFIPTQEFLPQDLHTFAETCMKHNWRHYGPHLSSSWNNIAFCGSPLPLGKIWQLFGGEG
jgi:hypothetical protein